MTLAIHLLSVGVWLGCVLTEALFERALLGTNRENESLLARLHMRVDLIIEIPAFLLVVGTGLLMLLDNPMSDWLLVKIGLGLLAVLANIYCVYLVFQRVRFSDAGDWDEFDKTDRLQHKIGAIVLLGILGATVTGIVAGT